MCIINLHANFREGYFLVARMYSENPKVIYVMFSYKAGVEDSEAEILLC